MRTPQQVRDRHRAARSTAPRRRAARRSALLDRWRRAVAADELWRFESAVVLGGAGAASFLFDDVDGVPQVTGLLEWHGLSVGDPATDLQWLASAPAAADDVYAAYVAHSGRAPDARARERARLYAELEFAKWLVHGHETGRDDVIDDAVGLLESLAAGVARRRHRDGCRARRRRRDRAARPHARCRAGRRRHVDADRRVRPGGAVALGDDRRRRRRRPTAGRRRGRDGCRAPTADAAARAARRHVDRADRHLGVHRARTTRGRRAGSTTPTTRTRRRDAERASEAALRRWRAE